MNAPDWMTEPFGLILVAAITVGGSWLTTRATNKTAARATTQTVAGQIESARVQAEEGAFDRAEAMLGRTLDRQDAEIRDLEAQVERLHQRNRELTGQVEDLQVELRDTRADLEAAKQLLALRYPDDPDQEDHRS